MEELKELLQERMKQHKLGPEAIASVVCYNINQLSDGQFTATRYKNGVLTLTVASSAAAADLQVMLAGLKKRFTERVSPHPINRIFIRQAAEGGG